jgi:hypothetical protein
MRRNAFFVAALLIMKIAALAAAQGMMGPGYGGGMMGWWAAPPGNAQALSVDQVADLVQKYLKDYWSPDLELTEVMEFDNQLYAEVKEKSTGIHAFELLVNRWTGTIIPEPGPNMMWNTKYSPMGVGMMGSPAWGWGRQRGFRDWRDSNGEMSVSPQQARHYAQEFLDARLPGTKVEDGAGTFYGYYSIHVLKDGNVYGMLGVNGYTGWVWYHEWHGKFIRMEEIGEEK